MLLLLSAGCDPAALLGGDDDDDDGTPTGPATTVEETLDRLGVSTAATARLSSLGTDLPADYTPIGATAEFSRVDEFLLFGIELTGTDDLSKVIERDTGVLEQLNTPSQSAAYLDHDAPDQAFTRTTRAAVGADVDADGREEMVIVWVDQDTPAVATNVNVMIREDALATVPYSEATQIVAQQGFVRDVAVAAGDWNGDGRDDLVIGLGTDTGGGTPATSVRLLFFLGNAQGAFVETVAAAQTFTPAAAGAPLSIQLTEGQLDFDSGHEIALVVNEYTATGDGGISTWRVYDDAAAAFAELTNGAQPVTGTDGAAYSAAVADLALGDIDGDGLDEILLGGIQDYGSACGDTYDFIFIARDDAAHTFASLGAKHEADSMGLHGCDDADADKLRWVHVNALDTEGDRSKELQFNQWIYNSFDDAAPFTEIADLGMSAMLGPGATDGVWYDRSTSAMAVGDVNADGRQDLLVYSQEQTAIQVYADSDGNGSVTALTTIPTDFRLNTSSDAPLIVPVNLDDDTIIVKVAEPTAAALGGGTGNPGDYKLVFSEPIILAVLAAAPCADGIGQNTDACYTTYGTATSSETTTEEVLSVSASVSVGVNIDGGPITQSEISLKATVSTEASAMTGNSYSLTKSVVYTTGPLEDSVIFTTLPYDTWTYTVVAHPDPTMVGQPITLSIPREPITLIAEREFFNNSLRSDDVQIGTNVFQHTVGDLSTYVTAAQKNALLAGGGLEIGPQSVGQGASSTEIGLAVGNAQSTGNSLAVGFEFEMEATALTVMAGFSVGTTSETSFQVTSGTETTYTGSIGSLDAEHFADNLYSYGLFTYRMTEPTTGRQFQVVNYWVE